MDNTNGLLYVQDWYNNRVSTWKQDGTPVTVYGPEEAGLSEVFGWLLRV